MSNNRRGSNGRGSRHYANLNPRKWERVRLTCFIRDGYRCQKCGTAGALECHHVIPLEKGGKEYDLDNLQTLCRGCHIAEHNPPDPEQAKWKAELRGMLE